MAATDDLWKVNLPERELYKDDPRFAETSDEFVRRWQASIKYNIRRVGGEEWLCYNTTTGTTTPTGVFPDYSYGEPAERICVECGAYWDCGHENLCVTAWVLR